MWKVQHDDVNVSHLDEVSQTLVSTCSPGGVLLLGWPRDSFGFYIRWLL